MSDSTELLSPAPSSSAAPPTGEIHLDLKDRWLAGFLAWLIPGAGHFYQRRFGKGSLFAICILGTFFYGIFLGSSRVVYASFRGSDGPWKQDDSRWAYLCQAGAGLPALPALVQAWRMNSNPPRTPLWAGWMAPPLIKGQLTTKDWSGRLVSGKVDGKEVLPGGLMLPADSFRERGDGAVVFQGRPAVGPSSDGRDPDWNELSVWHNHYGALYELGTVFTMIAGLLNILAIYDAWGGPVLFFNKPHPAPK